jgi:hypothetical protein
MSIEAMKQALEALEEGVQGTRPLGVATLEAISDLRQAIERAEKKHLEEIENVMLEIWQPVAGAWNPVYTTPQPQREWVGLTKEEVKEISFANRPYVVDMVVALEAKLKEKNT